MPYFRFEPAACYTQLGITYRPFLLDGKEIYKMKMSAVLGDNKSDADQEILNLCDKIKEITGVIVSPGELPQLIKDRKIVKNENNNQ